mmetsp:Transcript_41002/g.80684  ORF Transcript_41002/g.80684 Transcript_41002/m.80684 type:complete len:327 (+) Transcript_41002:113-1093(+)
MGRRRGKTIKALKKRASALEAEENETAQSASSLTNKRCLDDKQETRKRQRGDRLESAPRVTINDMMALQRSKKSELSDDLKGAEAKSSPAAFVVEASLKERENYVGLDCEMVGTGANGKRSVLARACLVDYDGAVIYDAFVKVDERVTDFRTQFSGVRPKNLKGGGAVTFADCCTKVAGLLKGKVLVGHALKNDLKVLLLSHPRSHIRDTATYRPLMRFARGKFKPKKLRDLSKQHLGMEIQGGEHTPDEDARAAMLLYRQKRKEWEDYLRVFKGNVQKAPRPVRQGKVSKEVGGVRSSGDAHTKGGTDVDGRSGDSESTGGSDVE